LFIENIKDLVKEQRKEIERAIIGSGKYELKRDINFWKYQRKSGF